MNITFIFRQDVCECQRQCEGEGQKCVGFLHGEASLWGAAYRGAVPVVTLDASSSFGGTDPGGAACVHQHCRQSRVSAPSPHWRLGLGSGHGCGERAGVRG